ncbi:MAG: hypothetical protein IJY71_01000 [Clostridia bacterium]|nr:hypothetical protein [Clostridia bacterium]
MDNKFDFLRQNGIFWSRYGFPYDPPRLTKEGKPLVFSEEYDKFLGYHQQFLEEGVKIHTCILHSGWVGVDTYDYSVVDKVLDGLMNLSEDILYMPRIKLNPPITWCKENPTEVFLYAEAPTDIEEIRALVGTAKHDILGYESKKGYYSPNGFVDDRPNVGGVISNQSFSSEKWKKDATVALERLLAHIEAKPYAHRIIGYMISFGQSGEPMMWGRSSRHYGDYSAVCRRAFYQYGLEKYGSQEALERAWGVKSLTPETPVLPSPFARYGDNRNSTMEELFRATPSDAAVIDYDEFISNRIADLLIYFSAFVKEKTGGKITGTFYGYFIECENANYAGHLAIQKILDSPAIDFMSAPITYERRGDGEPSGEMLPVMSVNRKKVWVDESDVRTYRARVADGVSHSGGVEESKSSLWREAAKNFSHNSGFWWMDLGDGWYNDAEMMKTVGAITAFREKINPRPWRSVSDVLVVLDENSLYRMKENYYMRQDFMAHFLANLRSSGVLVDVYRPIDLTELDLSRYKLVIFAYDFSVDSKIFNAIHLPKDATVLFHYAAGIWTDGVYSLDNTERLTGFRLYEKGSAEAGYPALGIEGYEGSLAEKTVNGRRHLIHVGGLMSQSELREIARGAGCHIYAEENLVLYGDNRFLFAMSKEGGACRVSFPSDRRRSDYLDGTPQTGNEDTVPFTPCGYKVYLFDGE